MTFLRYIAVFILIIALLIILFFAMLGFGIFSSAKSIVDLANQDINQTIFKTNNQINIIVPLKEEIGIRYKNINLCSIEDKEDLTIVSIAGTTSSTCCLNDICTVTIELNEDTKIPSHIYMYENSTGVCKKTKFQTEGHIVPINYAATIEFTDELLQMSNIDESKEYNVKSMNSNGTFSYQLLGSKKVSLSYEKKIKSDILLVDKKEIVNIIYK